MADETQKPDAPLDDTPAGDTPDKPAPGTTDKPSVQASHFRVAIRCPRDRYMRAGITFERGKQVIEGVDKATLSRLQADPCLIVVDVSPSTETGADAGQLPAHNLGIDVDPEAIRIAVSRLDKGNEAHFTRQGKPRVSAVCELLGANVNQAQITEALDGEHA